MTVQNEITVVVSKDKVKATTKGGAVANGTTHLDQLRLATIRVFDELLLDDTIHSRHLMEVLGQHLYAGIFEDVDTLLNDKLNEVKKERLRLQLQFDNDVDAGIVSLPWEFLYSPARQDFLATDVNLVLSRYMELGQDRETFTAAERPLRALIVISRPQDERTVLANDVIKAIENLNSDVETVVKLKVIDQPTLKSIEDALKEHEPHILHFIGHGKYDPSQKAGYLLLVNPDTNNGDQCSDTDLIGCFKRAQCYPKLVFLHMCEGGIVEKDATILQAFSGFAPKLIHAKIPSVVAMQYPIKNPDARDFSVAFYNTLAAGGSVDEAVQEGRSRLDLYRRSRLFGTPVLYMHSAGGLVLPKPPDEKKRGSSDIDQKKQESDTPPLVDTAAKHAPVEKSVLDRIILAGGTAAQAISDNNLKIALTQRLLKMKKDLADKTSAEIFAIIWKTWEQEAEPSVKDVWEVIMQAI